MADTFGALGQIDAGGRSLSIARLDALAGETEVARLPYTLRVLLENVLRSEVLGYGSADEVRAVAGWDAQAEPKDEISFRPARVLLQDFTGVPAIVDLAAMREAMVDLGGEAATINPQIPAELVIDHSVQVDEFGSRMAMFKNTEHPYEAAQFAIWATTDPEALALNSTRGGLYPPINDVVSKVPEMQEGLPFFGGQAVFADIETWANDVSNTWVWGPTMVQVNADIDAEFATALAGGQTLAEALDTIQAKTVDAIEAQGLTVKE